MNHTDIRDLTISRVSLILKLNFVPKLCNVKSESEDWSVAEENYSELDVIVNT